MVRADPELAAKLKIVDSSKTIINYANGSVYRAISAEAGTKHGLNPSMVIYDELAQAKSRALYDVLDTSMGAREEPLMIVISTQSNDPQHLISQLIDDGLNSGDPSIVCHLYEVPDEEGVDIFDEKNWYLANPALGDFRGMKDLRAIAEQAARLPSEEAKFRNLYLNQRVSGTASVVSRREWLACAGDARIEPGEEVFLALDLASVNDLAALAMVSAHDRDRLKVWMWKPDGVLRDHSDRDFGHGNWRYEEWAKAGWLETTPGRVIDHGVIADKIIWACKTYRVIGMAYDRHKIEYLMRELDRKNFPSHKEGDASASLEDLLLVPWGQGFVSMGPAIDALEQSITNRELVHENNPLLNWNFGNAIAVMDAASNRKLAKDKARFRIDGAQATAMVIGYKKRTNDGDRYAMDDFLKNAVMS
jgi:phage terminase large subunit-like protein